MKNFILIICFGVLISGCKKTQQNLETPAIDGKWELRQVFGGFSGSDDVFSPGNGHVVIYSSGNIFAFYQKDSVVSKGNYVIKRNSIEFNDQVYDGIYYNQSPTATIVQIKGDTLFLVAPFADGDGFKYVKTN